MRGLISVSLVAAGLAGSAFAHSGSFRDSDDSPIRRRKSLGFGPVHPHSVFRSSPYQIQTNGFLPLTAESDPIEVARLFVEDHLAGRLTPEMTFTIRKDSYTDVNTGVTHVYIRQIVQGIEVADGDINVNVKDGVVLSYGDSFYNGPAPTSIANNDDGLEEHPHLAFCSQLRDEVSARQGLLNEHIISQYGEQTPLAAHTELHEAIMGPVQHLHDSNCGQVDAPYQFAEKDSSDSAVGQSKRALLQFMIAATPNDQVLQDILARYDEYLSSMTSSFQTHLVGDHTVMEEVIDNVPDTVNPVKAKLAYVQVPKGDKTVLNLVWKFEIEMQDNWYETSVSASPPHRIISVVDWASDSPIPKHKEPATYNVFKWGINDPSEGNRTIQKENWDSLASPVGWHSIPWANDPQHDGLRTKRTEFWKNSTTTSGNNVFAHEDWEGRNSWIDNYRPDAGKDLSFDYKYDPKVQDGPDSLDEAKKYINATVTQLFYTTNLVHDLFYRYGFDEVSGNFQQYNFGRGGKENDAVIANAQDGSGYNNANFMTPPDGQNGRCRMYLWNTANPYRDGDLEAGIVIHELAHGLSTRLTGGPANSGCLGWGESGGMGEGWGDFLATTIRSNRNYSDYAMGAWAANTDKGIRNYIYSLDETINPSTYKTLDKPGYWGVHAIGEVWAEILWVVSQGLIAKRGYVDTLFPPTPLEDGTVPEGDFYRPAEYTSTGEKKPLIPKHGNSLSVQLVLNGMKLQQCRPSFFDARDAIIQADQILTGGENFCELWKGFAARGLGPDAMVEGRTPWGGGIRTNDHAVPLACKEEKVPEKPKAPEDEFVFKPTRKTSCRKSA